MIARILLLAFAVACSGGGTKTGASTTTPEPGETGAASSTAAGSGTAEALTGVGAALSVTPPDAIVTIDDVVMGKASELDRVIALAPGLHTLVIELPGYKAYRAEFSVTDKVEPFTVRLDPAK